MSNTLISDTTRSPEGLAVLDVLAWLTVERLAWLVVGLLAAALRLAGLARAPFTPAEAQQAVAALSLGGLPAPGVSPLLLSLHRLSFLLLDANELFARAWPALAGIVLVALVYQLRAELGRVGALGSAFLLAVSPLMLFWSRSAAGESFTLAAAMALIVALCRARRGQPWVTWIAVALALLALSSASSASVLVLAAPLAVLALVGRLSPDRSWLAAGLTFVGVVALGATAFFLAPNGLAAAADLPAEWLRQISAPAGYSLFWLLAQVTLGEALALVAGIAGLLIGLRRRSWLAQGLGLWLALGLALLLLRSGRTPADAALLALPLALLAGFAIEAFVAQFGVPGQRVEAAVLIAVCLVILGATVVWLADYTRSLEGAPRPVFLYSAVAGLFMALAIVLVFAVVFGRRVTWQAAAIVAALALGLLTVRTALLTSHNHDPLRWGTVAVERGAQDGRELTRFLERLAAQRGTDLRDLPVALIAAPGTEPAPLVRWLTRDALLRVAAGAGGAQPTDLLVSLADDPAPTGDAGMPPLVGRSFRIAERWSPAGLRGEPLLRWLLYGEHGTAERAQRAVVWLPAAAQ